MLPSRRQQRWLPQEQLPTFSSRLSRCLLRQRTASRKPHLRLSTCRMPPRGVTLSPVQTLTQCKGTWERVCCAMPCRALSEVMGYSHCTNVQAESLSVMLGGSDVVCKAKTGTGKTLAFLIPGIERVTACFLEVDNLAWVRCTSDARLRGSACVPQVLHNPVGQGKIAMLVLSPTRELAAQIAEEAKQLLKFQRMHVQARMWSAPVVLPFTLAV